MKFFNFLKEYFKRQDDKVDIQGAINELDKKHMKLQEALTTLYFQQSRLTQKKMDIESLNRDQAMDLQEAIKENKDELSLHLIEGIENSKEELEFLSAQLQEIDNDIALAMENKIELESSMKKYKEMLFTYDSRVKALNARKELKKDLGLLKQSIGNSSHEDTLGKLKDKIHLLNAELNVNSLGNDQVERELKNLRANRLQKRNLEKLNQLKRKYQSKDMIIANS